MPAPENQAEAQWHWVQNEAAAQALLDPVTLRYFSVFLSGPLDLHEAAGRLGLKRTTLRYHVGRFLRWGLLAPIERPNRQARLQYQVVHPRVYIPFHASEQASLEELLLAMQDPFQRTFVRSLVRAGGKGKSERDAAGAGILIRNGSVDFTLTAPPQLTFQEDMDANIWSSWITVGLTPAEATALKAELEALWARYRTLDPGRAGTRPHLLRLGLAPEETG